MILNNILLCNLLAAYNVDSRITMDDIVDMAILDMERPAYPPRYLSSISFKSACNMIVDNGIQYVTQYNKRYILSIFEKIEILSYLTEDL